jgi:nucleotide-binding universal stress UspA family protein
MPNAIRFDVHHPTRARRARLHAAPTRRAGKRPEPSTTRRLSRILVATDGTAASEGAVTVAGLLARRHHATVDVVSVLPRWGESPPAHEFLPITGELLEERLASVIPQGQRALGNGTPSWTIRLIDSSSIVDSIAETARTEGHDLIVTGNRGGWITRWLRRPTALAVAQRSTVPVLAVPESLSTLPARAVVGVDGTDADLALATSTVGVLAESAAVYLVHVDSAEATARLTAYAKRTDADLIALGDPHPATIADRVSGDTRRRILRAFDGFVLLRGTGNVSSRQTPESEGPGPWPQLRDRLTHRARTDGMHFNT